MAYAVIQDAIDTYGEDYVLTSVTRVDTPDRDAFDRALVKASSEIDTYAGAQYSTPVTPSPPVFVQYCIDIAIYRASSDAGTGTDEKRLRYEDAIKWLRLLASGTVVIDIDGDGETDGGSNGRVEFVGPTRLFSRATMGGL